MSNVDPRELEKFSELAHRWWDPAAEFKPLHEINPLRVQWMEQSVSFAGKNVLDVGCGGGILSEALAARGAQVTGIDLAEKALSVARLHLFESGHKIDYRLCAAEQMAAEAPGAFDVVTCMELLEHVPDPASVIRACARLLVPGGHAFFATLNRNLKSGLYTIVGAEYLLHMLPPGTHEYGKFLRPAELARGCRAAGLDVQEIRGISYKPLDKTYHLTDDTSVNYLLRARKNA